MVLVSIRSEAGTRNDVGPYLDDASQQNGMAAGLTGASVALAAIATVFGFFI